MIKNSMCRMIFVLSVSLTVLAVSQESGVITQPYKEPLRPQFHFTYRAGWLSDINGPFQYKGEFHLFTQHRPDNPVLHYPDIHWGHAVSQDLVHWEELPPALAPDERGPVFSGSCVVDYDNASGLKTGNEAPILAFYTAASYIRPDGNTDFGYPGTQCMAYSNDRGRTWTKYEKNPVVQAFTPGNRDPKVLYHAPSKQWIMIITLNVGAWNEDNRFMMLTSTNLKEWKELWRFEMPTGCDCPDMFELPVDGNPANTRWVIWSGDTTHMIGIFDGKTFAREGPIRKPVVEWMRPGSGGYAAQTFANMPDSDRRCIQMSWIRQTDDFPGMPFSQQASFPCELTLRSSGDGLHLYRYPIREIEILYDSEYRCEARRLEPGNALIPGLDSEAFDIDLRFSPGEASRITLNARGVDVVYDAEASELSCGGTSVPLRPVDGKITLRVLVDRCSVEIFANDGQLVMYYSLTLESSNRSLQLAVEGGRAELQGLTVHTIRSIWDEKD